MACQVKTGFLFWKKPCGATSVGHCRACGISACHRHGNNVEGNLVCDPCWSHMGHSAVGFAGTTVIHHHHHDHVDDVAFQSSDSGAFSAGSDGSGSWEDSGSTGGGSWSDPS
ncbi:MAG: hypothetical protein JWM80_2607 [Cyanobacteria bacterium RYN_339]|nr:hypothetical protein [Cyanobacteria bacterium RYN_339]